MANTTQTKSRYYIVAVKSEITEYVGDCDSLHKLPDNAIWFDTEQEAEEVAERIEDKHPKCTVVVEAVDF
jgi:hypothetical protein